MKLRRRLALAFALCSSAMLIVSRMATIESFRRMQQYQLDEGLRARAEKEGSEVALVGRKALEDEYEAQEEAPDPLEQLVTYGALYRSDGTLVADTSSFSHAPNLRELGFDTASLQKLRGDCFDFKFRGHQLRGVLVEVKTTRPVERLILLLAASRRDMDADARQLLAVGWWILAASIPLSLAVGWWFGRRMTREVESLAAAARAVTDGELDVPFEASTTQAEEVAALQTTLRDMVQRLKSLLETERRFASNAAHELRSPLAVLRGELELALRRPRTAEHYADVLRDALADTNRLIDLAENLLVVARAASGVVANAEEVQIRELLDSAFATSGTRTDRVVVDIVDADTIVGVREDLVRILRNLLDNARDHGGGGNPVRVHVRRALVSGRHFVRIAIEDDGKGVSADDRERVFEHFHRGADARQSSGAGLGLPIARELARKHGGDLVLESPQKPTRFVVTLPAHTPPTSERASSRDVAAIKTTPPATRNERLLPR